MRIGLFSDAFYPIISGVTISVATLSKELTKLGHDVIIITNGHELATFSENIVRFEGTRLPMKGLRDFRIGKVTNKKVNKIGTLNLDIIHCHTEFTMGRLGRKAAKRFNIPVVHTYHTMYEDYIHFITKVFKSPLTFLSKWYSKSFADSADEVIFPTMKVKNAFDGYGYEKSSHIIPTGIYLDKFRRQNYKKAYYNEARKKLGIKENDFVLLFLGRMSREKSVEALLKEFKKISKSRDDVKLLLVGGGPDLNFFKDFAGELGISNKVICTGMVPPFDVALYYHVADLFVNFSVTETQGLTYIEALASGVPLLVKYDDNLDGVIKAGENGYSFTDDLDFGPLFNKLYNDKELFNKITKNSSKACIERFSAENYALNVLDIYNGLLNK
ncbi:MAG: glycosyltransferase [Candidatus Izimaplasma sp.]|nr:glycosyltransferase [Candidatus Izimaplasma bacterium]